MSRSDMPDFSRSAGLPPHGKRTTRILTSAAPLTKELAQEKAKRAGFGSLGEYVHDLLVRDVHAPVHTEQITKVDLSRKGKN